VLDPAMLDTATSYHIETLPGHWQPIWTDRSEVVFHSPVGKLLIAADQLTLIEPGRLRLSHTQVTR
jgi:hypothetical protein